MDTNTTDAAVPATLNPAVADAEIITRPIADYEDGDSPHTEPDIFWPMLFTGVAVGSFTTFIIWAFVTSV